MRTLSPKLVAIAAGLICTVIPTTHAREATENDRAYCAALFDPHDEPSGQRFIEIDALKKELPFLMQLTTTTEATFKSMSQRDRVDVLDNLNFADVAEFVREHTEDEINLYSVYDAYLATAWATLARYARVDNPEFFDDEHGRPRDFTEFSGRRMQELKAAHANQPLGPLLKRILGWLPEKRAHRFEWVRELDRFGRKHGNLADLILGHQPVAALRREVVAELPNDRSPVNVGLHRDRLYTPYPHLTALWNVLEPADGETLIDLGAGNGRVGLSLRAHGHATRFIGYELLASRVVESANAAEILNLRPSRWRVERADISLPTFDLPPADYYFLSNPMVPSQIDQLMAKLGDKARAGDAFRVIVSGLPLFAEAARDWPEEFGDWATLYAPLPKGLTFERRIGDGDDSFFILKSTSR